MTHRLDILLLGQPGDGDLLLHSRRLLHLRRLALDLVRANKCDLGHGGLLGGGLVGGRLGDVGDCLRHARRRSRGHGVSGRRGPLGDQDRVHGGYRLAELRVQLHHLLVLGAADVGRVRIGAGARHVAQLAAERVAAARGGARGAALHTRLLLLVLLALQMLLVGLRARARDLAHFAVVQLLRLRRNSGTFEDLARGPGLDLGDGPGGLDCAPGAHLGGGHRHRGQVDGGALLRLHVDVGLGGRRHRGGRLVRVGGGGGGVGRGVGAGRHVRGQGPGGHDGLGPRPRGVAVGGPRLVRAVSCGVGHPRGPGQGGLRVVRGAGRQGHGGRGGVLRRGVGVGRRSIGARHDAGGGGGRGGVGGRVGRGGGVGGHGRLARGLHARVRGLGGLAHEGGRGGVGRGGGGVLGGLPVHRDPVIIVGHGWLLGAARGC